MGYIHSIYIYTYIQEGLYTTDCVSGVADEKWFVRFVYVERKELCFFFGRSVRHGR